MRILLALLIPIATLGPVAAQQPSMKTDFAHDVVPILKAQCAKCHTNGTYKGGLSLDTREDIAQGEGRRAGQDGRERAHRAGHEQGPRDADAAEGRAADGEGGRGAGEVDRRRACRGSRASRFKPTTYVAPLKPRRPTLPAAQPGREHPIDRIVDAYFAANKVPAPQPLDDAAFARRVYLDLIGLLPRRAELEAFLADTDADKRATARPQAARREPRLRRPLADLLERPAPQRLRGHRLHRRRPQADHRAGSTSRCWRTSPTTSSSAS